MTRSLGMKSAVALVATLVWLVSCSGSAHALGQRVFLYVNTDATNDGGNGSLAFPYKKLNTALQRAYKIRYTQAVDPTQPPVVNDIDVIIKLTAVTTPVGPVNVGTGVEDKGWQSWQDIVQGVTHPAFPIRMIKRVSIDGVRSGGQRPRIVIDEIGSGATFALTDFGWNGLPKEQHSYFHAADNSSLSNLFLDGTGFFNKATDEINGIYFGNVTDATVSNCRVEDMFKGLYFFSDKPSQAPLPDPPTAAVWDTDIISAGPLHDPPDLDQDQGHAGVWIAGSGFLDVAFSHCLFEACHDGVEVAGEVVGMASMSGTVNLDTCTFHNNENGVETVGSGTLTTTATSCLFDTNVNQIDGMLLIHDGLPNSPGAIAARNMTNNVTVRSSTFFNNAFGIIVNSIGTFDLGQSGLVSPGHNTFDYNFGAFPGGTDPIRVALFVQKPGPGVSVTAGGNTWYHFNGNQGTSSTGCLTGPQTGLPVLGTNLYPATKISTGEVFRVPPGPGAGICCDQGADWKRNYSLQPNATVNFGTSCLP